MERVNNSTLRWELSEMKHKFANQALTKALEFKAYLDLSDETQLRLSAAALPVCVIWIISSWQKTLLFLTSLSGGLKKTWITCRRFEAEDHAIILVAEIEIETAAWTGETKMIHGRTKQADMELTQESTGMYTCLRAIDKTVVTINARDMA